MNISRLFYKIVIISLLLCLGLLLGYGIWWTLSNYWAIVLFYGYLIVAILYLFLLLFGLFVSNKIDNPIGQTFFLLRTIEARKDPSVLDIWRNKIVSVLEVVASSISFPSDLFSELFLNYKLGLPNTQQKVFLMIANNTLYPQIPLKIFLTFCFLVIICLIGSLQSFPKEYTDSLLIFMAVYATLKVLSFTLSPIDLVSRLRKGARNSYISFITIGVFLYLIMVVSFTSLITGIHNLSIAEIISISAKMFNLKATFTMTLSLFSGDQISIIDYVISVLGLLYYISVLKIFWSYKDFRRTNEDIVATAGAYLTFGRYNTALELLSKVDNNFKGHLVIKALAFLGVNQLEKAFETFQHHFILNENKKAEDARIYRELLAAKIFCPIPNTQILQLFKNLLNSNAKDAHMAFSFTQIDLISDTYLLNKVLEHFSEPEIIERFPLTQVNLELLMGNPVKAQHYLQQISPTTGIDEIFRCILVLFVSITNSDDKTADLILETWIQNHLPVIEESMTTIYDEDKVMVSTYLKVIIPLIKEISPTKVEELQFVIDEINTSISTDEIKRANYYIQSKL